MLFFTYLGFFSFIGLFLIFIVVSKELKKQLPNEDEKKILVECGLIQQDEKNKKVLREKCQVIRTFDFVINNIKNYPKLKAVFDKMNKDCVPFNVIDM